MKKRFLRMVACVLCLCLLLSLSAVTAVGEELPDISALYKNKDIDASWDKDATVITLQGESASASEDTFVTVSGNTVTITGKGDYVLTGPLQGQVVIAAGEEDKVHLILQGAEIVSPEGPAIYEKSCDKLIVTLAEGTENVLADTLDIQEGEDRIASALYAEDDLSINGSGTLEVFGNSGNGIQSKADLIIAGGEITLQAANDGIKGRNSVLVLGGTLNITAENDGLVSSRKEKEDKGWIFIAGGEITIHTGSGAGEIKNIEAQGPWGRGRGGGWDWDDSGENDTPSRKGIKAENGITVTDGTLVLDTEDDALHSNSSLTIYGGTLSIRTGDDALHADEVTRIVGGEIDIAQCYEGIEGEKVEIAGGKISVVASDDGVNAAGGAQAETFGGWGRGGFDEADHTNNLLLISGGLLEVTAGGDALDSNGSIQMTGGVVGVFATSSMGEGPIDYNGSGTQSGGTLIVATTGGSYGSSGAMQGLATLAVSSISGASGEEIQVLDGSGTVLGRFTPKSGFDSVLVSSDSLPEGTGVTVTVGGESVYAGQMQDNAASYGDGFGQGGWGRQNRRRGW
ncbi:MAG: carbohydrate-binding domain-containing protein [Clostridia bacterium]|nr:carbohydrate-binding domain-containing protein [Clostridia bacterium]